jgi:hypothetical protein
VECNGLVTTQTVLKNIQIYVTLFIDDPLRIMFHFLKAQMAGIAAIVEIAEVVSAHVTHGEHMRGVTERCR